ncbi:MAG: serine/threonine-protein kinase [Nannocystaceae bacterium]
MGPRTPTDAPPPAGDVRPRGGLEDTLLRETADDEAGSLEADDLQLERGATIGRYVVLERIGAGGMGVVYAAYDPDLDRRVALKILRSSLADDAAGQARSRLLREGKAMARVRHPNVVAVHDVGTDQGRVFIAMEFVDGGTLTDWLAAGPHSRDEILEVFLAAGEGLASAHRQGLVHRDFKPDNVLIAREGRVCVVDFGLARRDAWAADAASEPPTDSVGDEGDHDDAGDELAQQVAAARNDGLALSITRTGMLLGTPAYMAPEQHLGLLPGAAADQFAFCVALYEALYGERPFVGASLAELLHNVMEGEVAPAPERARVPAWIRRVLLRGLHRKPRQRWPDMEALLEALGQAPGRRRRGWQVASLAALALVGGGLGAWAGLRGPTDGCDDGAAAWVGLWDDEAKARYAEAFVATGRGFAETTWAAVQRDGDDYVRAWRATHLQACEATRVHRRQSPEVLALRQRCLDRARGRLATLAGLFEQPDAEIVAGAVDALRALPAPDCEAKEVLRDDARLRGTPQARAERVAEQRNLDRARVLVLALRLDEAAALCEQTRARARALGDGPLEAEALLVAADVDEARGHTARSREGIEAALLLAETHDDDRLAARAWLELLWVDGFRDSRYAEAHAAAAHAEALLRRWPELSAEQGVLIARRGDLLYAQGRYEEALAHHREVLQRREASPPHDPRRADALTGMGLAELELGRHEEALAHLRDAEAIVRQTYGDGHPHHAAALTNLGTAYDVAGDLPRAGQLHARALAVAEAAYGPGHPAIAEILNNHGGVRLAQERLDEAEAAFVRAREIWVGRYGDEHPDLAMVSYTRALVAEARGDRSQARALHEDALRRRERGLGPEHPDVGTSLQALAELDEGRRDLASARRRLARAVRIFERALGPDSESVVDARLRMQHLDRLGRAESIRDGEEVHHGPPAAPAVVRP